ncbi:MAG: DUF6622 family protein [Pseudomonadota bacterium]
MLLQILNHTPLYVWAILAFLIARGMAASVEREIAVGKLFIIPLAMLALSLHGMVAMLGAGPALLAAWAAGALAAAAASWKLSGTHAIVADPVRGVIRERGSWAPLALMMAVFFIKYAVAVTLALAPALRQDALFVTLICALYGVINGIFFGRLCHRIALYRQAAMPKTFTPGQQAI